jgi:hypothetical protein
MAVRLQTCIRDVKLAAGTPAVLTEVLHGGRQTFQKSVAILDHNQLLSNSFQCMIHQSCL